MSRVRIVTDSTADVPPDIAARLGIAVVPCEIYLGPETYRDGVDLTVQELFAKMAHTVHQPRTAQPPVADFVGTYRRLLDDDGSDAVISIHIAGSLAGTVNAAWAAAQMMPDPSRVEVIDSGQLSMGAGWAAIKAAEWAEAGAARGEVSRAVRAILPRLRVVAIIDTLDSLLRGGRISHLSAALGTVLQIKPLLALENGSVAILDKVRTRSRALARLIEHVRSWQPLAELAVLHIGAEALAEELASTLEETVAPQRVLIAPAGAAVASHLGLGAVGACALMGPR